MSYLYETNTIFQFQSPIEHIIFFLLTRLILRMTIKIGKKKKTSKVIHDFYRKTL